MKRKKTTVYKIDPTTKDKKVAAILEFNDEGKRLLEQYYMFDGETVNEETKYSYDDNGNLTLTVVRNHEAESQRVERQFDSNNNLLEEKIFVSGDNLEQHKKVTWESDNLSSKAEFFDVQGELLNIVETVLLEKGVIQKEAIYDERKRLIEAYEYSYENGNLVKKVADFGGFSTEENYTYTLDSNGNITSKIRVDDEGDTETQEAQYHPNGKKARQEITLVSGAKEVIEYDEQEREISVHRLDVTGYKSFESLSKHSDEHKYLVEKVVRNDESITKFLYEYEFFEEPENA